MKKEQFYFWDEMWNQEKNKNNQNEEITTENSMEDEEI